MMPYISHKTIYPFGFTVYPWFIFHYLLAWPFGFYYYIKELLRRKDLDFNFGLQFFILGFLGAVAVARIFNFYGPWTSYEGMTFWQRFLLMFSTDIGGWVAYGGIIGAFSFGYIYAWIKKQSFLRYIDPAAPGIAMGFFIARLGCFIGSCCWGSHSDLPFAIQTGSETLHPVQLYNSLMDLAMFAFLLSLNEKREKESKADGYLFFWFLILYSFGRFFTEFLRGDYGPSNYYFGLTATQLLCIATFMIAVPALAWTLNKKQRARTRSSFHIKARTYALMVSGGVMANIGAYMITPRPYLAIAVMVIGMAVFSIGLSSIFKPKN